MGIANHKIEQGRFYLMNNDEEDEQLFRFQHLRRKRKEETWVYLDEEPVREIINDDLFLRVDLSTAEVAKMKQRIRKLRKKYKSTHRYGRIRENFEIEELKAQENLDWWDE